MRAKIFCRSGCLGGSHLQGEKHLSWWEWPSSWAARSSSKGSMSWGHFSDVPILGTKTSYTWAQGTVSRVAGRRDIRWLALCPTLILFPSLSGVPSPWEALCSGAVGWLGVWCTEEKGVALPLGASRTVGEREA